MKKQILILMAFVAFSFNANAVLDLRAGYGIQTPGDDDGGTLETIAGFNLDAIINIPMVPFGFGLRYENMGKELSGTIPLVGAYTADMSVTRVALLINYRIIDLFAYFGLIGTVGLVNDASLEFGGVLAGANAAEYDSPLTYSAGLEGGFSFGLISVGGELGYIAANFEQTNNPSNTDVDLSGIYAKALVGIGF